MHITLHCSLIASAAAETQRYIAMPAFDSPTLLVARFLKSNGYDKTLAAFLEETGLDASVADPEDPKTALTIERVLEEKKLFDLSLKLEKVEIVEGEDEFTVPYPAVPRLIAPAGVPQSNVLFVSVGNFDAPFNCPLLIATTADRALRLYNLAGTLLRTHTHLHSSAILSVTVLQQKWLISTSMSGHVVLSSADTGEIVYELKAHEKYAIKAVLYKNEYLATAAYDKTINVYLISYSVDNTPSISGLLGRLELPTPPEALCFVTLPISSEPALCYSRRDSTFLYYHHLCPLLPPHSTRNLAPHSTSWHTFHAMWLSPSPSNPSLLAVATSSIPHMKFLLLPVDSDTIIKEVFTAAPQSVYSTAVLAWRPQGNGVWVNADDGIVRGIEVKSGKVKVGLRASAGGEKVRTLWAGHVDGREMLVTGGFDKGLKVWSVEGEEVSRGVGEQADEVGGANNST